MIDPVSAFAIASTAYTSIKKVIGHAQELEGISKQLGSWYKPSAGTKKSAYVL